jgi:hypothetical protein
MKTDSHIKEKAKTVSLEHRFQFEKHDMINKFDLSSELFREGEKWGLKNAIGEIIAEPAYDDFMRMNSEELDIGDRVVAKQNDKWGVLLLNGSGLWLVEPQYDYVGYPNPITHVRKGDKWGVIKLPEGEFLLPLECDSIDDWNGFMFSNGISFYSKNGKIGVITEWGKYTEAIYEDIDFDPDL